MRVARATRVGAASFLILAACRHAPPAPPQAEPARRTPVASATPLRLLETSPAAGEEVLPGVELRLRFDRPVEASTVTWATARLEYVGSRRTFIADPFRAVGIKLSEEAALVALDPANLLPGEVVRLTLSGVSAADGGPLQGAPIVLTWHVAELPPL